MLCFEMTKNTVYQLQLGLLFLFLIAYFKKTQIQIAPLKVVGYVD
jgi:hypothetical protein